VAVPYVHSGYERRADDHYPTIDGRCVQALVETWPISGFVEDCCAPRGSGIVDWLRKHGTLATCRASIEDCIHVSWVVTNPPYMRSVVDKIVTRAVEKVGRRWIGGAAFLMRANWDLAACRAPLFADPLYRGQTRMRFRPWWSEDRKAQPIHNYVWHVWAAGNGEPVIRYWQP
jgi:hypothetical protein